MNVLLTYEVITDSGSVTLQATCEEMARLEAADQGLEVRAVHEVTHDSR